MQQIDVERNILYQTPNAKHIMNSACDEFVNIELINICNVTQPSMTGPI